MARGRIRAGASVKASDYINALKQRAELRREFENVIRSHDALITLSGFELPCRMDDTEALARTYGKHARMPFNLTGSPALAVPTGFSRSGLPLGMQIIGKAFDEPMVYRIAWAYCDAAGFTERKPDVMRKVQSPAVA
jgi:aspartyl-tRNA(Asn)/glutamyl-tRNA(Gln) amidotransferase subunit A